MLIQKGDGTYITGPADVWVLWRDVSSGKYHPAFFEEHPLPGPIEPIEKLDIIRLKSRLHHTKGFETIDEAKEYLMDMAIKFNVPENNLCSEPIDVDLSQDYAMVWLVGNWIREKSSITAIKGISKS